MKYDVGSNYTLTMDDVSATDDTAATTAVDHADGQTVSFIVYCKSVATSLDGKTQYSVDNSTWVDYPASDAALNDDDMTQIVAAGSQQLNVPTPRARYSRVLFTSVGAVVAVCASVLGPDRHVTPA